MVGGRFEKAYLRMDRAADCSCAEMIYISRNTHTHTFFEACIHRHAYVCETQVHVIAVELHMTRKINCKINLHICLWQNPMPVDYYLCLVTVWTRSTYCIISADVHCSWFQRSIWVDFITNKKLKCNSGESTQTGCKTPCGFTSGMAITKIII